MPLPQDPLAQIEGALVLGIRDYVRKCGFTRVHLGLSGGIDSALVAVLAVEALGADRVVVCGLPSRYSSEGSVADARALADALGISLEMISIEDIFGAFLNALQPTFAGTKPDITEDNIQARIRGTLLMAYSNKFNSLLLTTGNKSELATGYCTLYGDMSGGLAVIGDLLKMQVYAVARSINARSPLIPEAILTKPPSAELRPDQKDQDSLPPYETLDAILDKHLVQNLSVEDIAAFGFDKGLVRSVIAMVEKAEYKRRQAPPVLKVSPKAFGTGRRIPIARKMF
jgi:NAD+ synthase (glutamine-hydrolysing)